MTPGQRHRYELAGDLLEMPRLSGADFAERVAAVVGALGAEEREILKALVDWVGDYEAEEGKL
jgi:negative regulator of sigma E activity